jgi:alpha-amylase
MGQPRISLALVLHNHQPIGNFGFVFEENHLRAYQPMLEALEKHPRVRIGLHYTGPLLEWLRAERPRTIERLGELIARGQVEIVGGGYYEPVLASLPERDRVGQLIRMADELENAFGARPRGAWLAERVWEPDVPTSLVDAGYQWTILDDAHFRAAAIPEEALWGAFSTDDQGKRLAIFGTEQGLRYRIPFGTVESVIDYLRGKATEDGRRVGMMGDDGEKFGAWPTTWEHCWADEQWVERFFEALEANGDWLTTITPSDWLDREPPVGRVYVPTGSYAEMGEWALPADEALRFSEVLHRDLEEGRPEPRWMRGGFWRNFQVKYREVNDLHKQMLRVSDLVDALPAGPLRERPTDHLYRGQSNDCYWHGLFGGIYLSHMRLATLGHLIAAEDLSDPGSGVELADLDLDGVDELLVRSPGQVVAIKLTEGAGIGSWDIRSVRHGIASVLRRRPEAYHAKLVAFEEAGGTEAAALAAAASIHDIVKVREPGLSGRLWYDAYERRLGLVHILPATTTPDAFARAEFHELGDFVDQPFTVRAIEAGEVIVGRLGRVEGVGQVEVVKVLRFAGDRREPTLDLEVNLVNRGGATLDALLAVEWPVNMLGGGGNPAAWLDLGEQRVRFDTSGSVVDADRIGFGNDSIGVAVTTELDPRAAVWWSSIDTVSLSEDGFERNHQGCCLVFAWPISLAPGGSSAVRMIHTVTTARDHAEDEAAQRLSER